MDDSFGDEEEFPRGSDSSELPDHLEIEDIKEEKAIDVMHEENEEDIEEKPHPNIGMEIETSNVGLVNAELVNSRLGTWEEVQKPPYTMTEAFIPPKLALVSSLSPFDLFYSLIGRSLIGDLVFHTNKYAFEFFAEEETQLHLERHPRSMLHRWQDTDTNEMMKFLSMVLSMAISERGDIQGIFF